MANCPKCGTKGIYVKEWEMKGRVQKKGAVQGEGDKTKQNILIVQLYHCPKCQKKFKVGKKG